MSEKIIKVFQGQVKGVNEKTKEVETIISTEAIDRDKEIVTTEAIKNGLTNYLAHPVLLANHNYKLLSQIGVAVRINPKVEQGLTEAVFKYFVGEGNPEADWGFTLAKNGVAAYSIGFFPKSWEFVQVDGQEVRKYTEIEIFEISQVVVPANPSALLKEIDNVDETIKRIAIKGLEILKEEKKNKEKGNKTDKDKENQEKMAVSTRRYPKDMEIDNESPWNGREAEMSLRKWASSDGSGDKNTIDFKKYELGFAYVDENDSENFRAYKLPHHYVKDGVFILSRRGTISAMASLLGARGGVDLPDKDREAVYKHLSYDYKLLDMTPPPLKSIDAPVELIEELLEMKYLQEKNQKDLKDLAIKLSAVKSALELYPYGAINGNEAEEKEADKDKGLNEVEKALQELSQTLLKNFKGE